VTGLLFNLQALRQPRRRRRSIGRVPEEGHEDVGLRLEGLIRHQQQHRMGSVLIAEVGVENPEN
jgi:hypothetical protein